MEGNSVLISEFKAKCIALMKEVHSTGRPLTVTLRGKPLVRVEPVSNVTEERALGGQSDDLLIRGNILQPTLPVRPSSGDFF
ncbi:MAG: type II toxin-antitoxin system prevent-host-death family antitoxin [Opitutales bacterium]